MTPVGIPVWSIRITWRFWPMGQNVAVSTTAPPTANVRRGSMPLWLVAPVPFQEPNAYPAYPTARMVRFSPEEYQAVPLGITNPPGEAYTWTRNWTVKTME